MSGGRHDEQKRPFVVTRAFLVRAAAIVCRAPHLTSGAPYPPALSFEEMHAIGNTLLAKPEASHNLLLPAALVMPSLNSVHIYQAPCAKILLLSSFCKLKYNVSHTELKTFISFHTLRETPCVRSTRDGQSHGLRSCW